jgi:hypothetical protein
MPRLHSSDYSRRLIWQSSLNLMSCSIVKQNIKFFSGSYFASSILKWTIITRSVWLCKEKSCSLCMNSNGSSFITICLLKIFHLKTIMWNDAELSWVTSQRVTRVCGLLGISLSYHCLHMKRLCTHRWRIIAQNKQNSRKGWETAKE